MKNHNPIVKQNNMMSKNCYMMSMRELQDKVREINAKATDPDDQIDFLDQTQSQICERITEVLGQRAVPGFVTEDVLDKYVVRLSNELVETLQEPPTAKNQMRVEALRALGADERKASREVAFRVARTPQAPWRPQDTVAVRRSAATESKKTLKMMIGRVLSAYRQNKMKKDGTPLYIAYLDSLQKFVEANPEAATLEQLAAMYAEIGVGYEDLEE
jgi:hypothetical protein